MNYARLSLVFALGLFALLAQTLLFRQFLPVFEGNELAIGCYFGAWLFWVSAGAMAVRHIAALRRYAAAELEWASLLYIPAFLAQYYLFMHARAIAGAAAYEVFPFTRMALLAWLASAPVSLATGALFTAACEWLPGKKGAVPLVYIAESLGGAVAGVVVTLLLAHHTAPEAIALAGMFVVAAASGLASMWRRRWAHGLPAALLLLLLAMGVGGRWADASNRLAWERMLPGAAYAGTFSTAQAAYAYGERNGQFVVVANGSVAEALPDEEHASAIAAAHLAQRPGIRNALVFGAGSMSICMRLLDIPQLEHATWLCPDPEYPQALMQALPPRFQAGASRVDIQSSDLRAFLAQDGPAYDLILLNLPNAASLALNRYATRECFSLLLSRLTPNGIVSLRIPGGENYLGGELEVIGASALATLESVFPYVTLKPGGETWLMASRQDFADRPGRLRRNYARIPGANALYPVQGIPSLFRRDRIDFQLGAYRAVLASYEARGARETLINTDRKPACLFDAMLLVLRQAGVSNPSAWADVARACSMKILLAAICIYGVLRAGYRFRTGKNPGVATFDNGMLVFTTGFAGMAFSILLMFLYQIQHGSLFLYIGLISALFMCGIFIGSLLARRLLEHGLSPRLFLAICLPLHAAMLLSVLYLPMQAPHILFVVFFLAGGIFTGVYFPVAAHRLETAGQSAAMAGGLLEALDALGGAAGGAAASLLLLPAAGANATAGAIALLLAANAAWFMERRRPASAEGAFERLARPTKYVLAGLAVMLLTASYFVEQARAATTPALPPGIVPMLAGKERTPETAQARMPNGETLPYLRVLGPAGQLEGYVFSTAPLAPGVSGYAGPIELAVFTDTEGVLHACRVMKSRESPAYLERTESWQTQLLGRNIFAPDPFIGVDAASGATLSSNAIRDSIESAGRLFAAALGRTLETKEDKGTWRPGKDFILLALLLLASIVARIKPRPWLRRVVLLSSLLLGGLWLNMQYSTQQVLQLLALEWPGFHLDGPCLLAIGVPALVLLFGNVYCGYACPFGALQELVGELRPAVLQTDPPKRLWRYGRAVKYLVLLFVIALFAFTRDYAALAADPLLTVFAGVWEHGIGLLAGGAVALSFFYRRFWCRNLCPAGAFLAFLNGIRMLRVWRPAVRPPACDLGVEKGTDLDCLCCDRCRHENT